MKRLFFLLISILILSGSPKNAEATECTLSLLKSISNKSSIETVQYIYVLAAPYYTTVDNLPLRKLRAFWSGNPIDRFSELLMTGQTKAAFTEKWGKPAENASIIVLQKESILKEAWSRDSAWALLPFEELEPRWKVISVRGMDPFDFDFDMEKYALTFTYEILPESTDTSCTGKFTGNFDPEKLTSITLTGTTAMARNLAFHIEEDGLFYPIENIRDTLFASDILHISNEASFYDDCPPAVPLRGGSRFCSSPKYFAILEALGTDIIELTGNHNLDWGPEPFLYSLDLYQKAGIPTYGGGKTLTEGQQPILLEHHGNKIAFLGCNAIGPENIFATEEKPGSPASETGR